MAAALTARTSFQVMGEGRCPIVGTWWQMETESHMITPLPGAKARLCHDAITPSVIPAQALPYLWLQD